MNITEDEFITEAEGYADAIERRGCSYWSGLRKGYIAGRLQSQNLQQTVCYVPLRDDIKQTVEYYKQKMKEQSEVGDYSSALLYQTKISALEDVLIKMKHSYGT